MPETHVARWLEHVRLRATNEGGERKPVRSGSKTGSGRVIRLNSAGTRCYVSVSRRSAASPGAACSRYHEQTRDAEGNAITRDNVEILRDDDVDDWRGDRWSIIVSPQSETDLVQLADRLLEQLEMVFGALRGTAWLHHAEQEGKHDHLHMAVQPVKGRILLTQRRLEKAVGRAQQMMERTRARVPGR